MNDNKNCLKINDFESSLKELESIITELENPEISLDEALKKYEKGIKLYRACLSFLEKAEKRIQILTKDENGEIILEDQEYDIDAS